MLGCQNFNYLKSIFPLGIPSVQTIVFNIYNSTSFEFVWGLCNCLIPMRSLSAKVDIISFQCKSISYSFKVKETHLIALTSHFMWKQFSERSRRIPAKKKKDGLISEWMLESILKLKSESVFQYNLLCMHFLIQAFRKSEGFLKCHLVVGGMDSTN